MYEKSSPFTIKRTDFKYSPISEKSVQSSHYIQEITSFQPHPSCSYHTNDYISHICMNCNYQCLCGTCLKEGNHKTHNIKNIQKSVKIVERILSQYAIRLRSKSDILTLLNQSLNAQKTQIYHQFCQHRKIINEKFGCLINAINQRQDEILTQLQEQQHTCFNKIQAFSKEISQGTTSSIKLIEIISENLEKLQPTGLCLFFANRKAIIEDALNQEKIITLKSQMPDVKLCFDQVDYDHILEKIKILQTFPESKINRSASPKKILKKNIKNLGKTVLRHEKQRNSHYHHASQTPKEHKFLESQKDITKFFKSPTKHLRRGASSGKLLSMPSSAEKQKLSKNPSPAREEFKKKGRKNKK